MKYFIKTTDNSRVLIEDLNYDAEKTLLFIHGWPLNHNIYEYQLNTLPKKGYRCIGVDLRGFGESDRPYTGYDYNTMASDIKKIIDVLKLDNITLVGHSMGAALAIRYVSKYNSFGVSKICLIGAAAPSWIKTENWTYGYTKEEVDMFIDQSLSDRPKLISDVSNSFFYKYVSQPLLNWFFDICLSASGWATAQCLMSLRDERLFNDIPNIKIPTLILHGTHDKICPYEFAQYLNKNIKNSTLVPLTESGHGAFIEEMDKVNNHIIKFVEM